LPAERQSRLPASCAAFLQHGKRTLNDFAEKDLRQVIIVPAAAAAAHDNAIFVRNLFDKANSRRIQPAA
jgi:hypothetical protein